MSGHLTDEQMTDRLAGAEDAAAREHLAACSSCREEEERLRRGLAQYREAQRAATARPEAFWQWQQTAIAARLGGRSTARQRWTWAGAMAMVVLAATLLLRESPPPSPVIQTDPDHALLVDVERSVRRELPRALEPAALLAQEVSRSAETRPNP